MSSMKVRFLFDSCYLIPGNFPVPKIVPGTQQALKYLF